MINITDNIICVTVLFVYDLLSCSSNRYYRGLIIGDLLLYTFTEWVYNYYIYIIGDSIIMSIFSIDLPSFMSAIRNERNSYNRI